MSDKKLNLTLQEEDSMLFKRCARKLLDSTFILAEKDQALYDFISKESNRQDMSDYLQFIGFDVFVEHNTKLAMLRQSDLDMDAIGLKRANLVKFNTLEFHLLLVLWGSYLEKLGYEKDVCVTKGDIVDKITSYGVVIDKAKLNQAMLRFKKYSLINYDKYDTSEACVVQLYPSIQFGWNVPQLKEVFEQYQKVENPDEEEEESEEEENDGNA